MLPAEVLSRSPQRSNLLGYVEGEPWPEAIERVHEWHAELGQLRDWAVGPPEFVDAVVDDDHTVGVVLRLLPPVDQDGSPNPVEVERALLVDVEAFIASAERLTEDGMLELAFELDGQSVGWVEDGSADRMLAEGLLAPWRARASVR